MFALKDYQEKALKALEGFLRRARAVGIEAAWRECAPVVTREGGQLPYRNEAFGEIPCVCLRLPTGGGKPCWPPMRWRGSARPIAIPTRRSSCG